jgi:phospholipid transport system substrate-binding protein
MTRLLIDRRCLFRLAGLAGLAGLTPCARAAADPAAVAPIQTLCNALLQIMRLGASTSFSQRLNVLAPAIDTAFDLNQILQVSVGFGWSGTPPGQQAALQTAFRSYTVASYVNSFNSYSGQRFTVSPYTRSLPNGELVVDTQIISPSGESHRLDYVMHRGPRGWQAVDVLEDGTISRVAVQRSDFRQILQQGGPAALVASLQRKTQQLAGGV